MKTQVLKSLVYSFPLLVLVVISAGKGVNAQDKKSDKKEIRRSVIIIDGDTTVNGKALSEMSKSEKERVRKELNEHRLDGDVRVIVSPKGDKDVTIIRKRVNGTEPLKWRTDSGARRSYFRGRDTRVFTFRDDSVLFHMGPDSIMKRFHIDSLGKFHGAIGFPRDFSIAIPNAIRSPRARVYVDGVERPGIWGAPERANTQNFSFRNTDKDGISTRINISVSNASKEQFKKITGKDEAGSLTIQDLIMSPNFSSGKVAIMFTLPAKGTATVKLLDNELKPVFSESLTQSSFSKQVMMARNGVYYLVVSQGNKHAVKRIVKQQ